MEKKEETVKVPEAKKEDTKKEEEEEKVEVPVVGPPKNDFLFNKLKSKNSLINIVSFLPIKDLVEATKDNRYVYNIVMNEDNRKKNILKWEFTFEEEQLLNTFLTDLTNENSQYDDKLKADERRQDYWLINNHIILYSFTTNYIEWTKSTLLS